MQRRKTKFTGVYVRISETKRCNGRPDECFDITFKLPDGGKRWEKVGWKSEGYTAAMASEIRSERLRDIRHGKMPAVRGRSRELTFGQAWALYYEKQIEPKHASGYKHPDQSRFDVHLGPRFADTPLSAITALDLERLKTDLVRAGQSPQSVKHALAQIRRVYRKMIAWDKWFGRVPTDKVDMPQFDNRRHRWLTPEEADQLLAELQRRSAQWQRISLMSLHTGMRAGEIFALKGQDVRLGSGEIHVLHSRKHSEARTVYMTPTVRTMFEGLALSPGRPVFASRTGRPIREVSATFTRSVDALGFNEGVDDARARVVFHTLRHTFGSWLAQAGVPLYDIGELMGHAEEETTRRYAHLCPNRQRRSAAIIEAASGGQPLSPGHTSSPGGPAYTLQGLFGGTE